jgi:iron complex transport system substrate-binding protein
MKNLVFLFSAFLVACSGSSEDASIESNGPGEAGTAESEVATAKAIVTLGGSITETVYALGEGSRIVGVDASSLYPPEATEQDQVGYYRQVSAEGIISLAPDLVIASDAAGPADALEQVKGVGVPVEVVSAEKTLAGAKSRIVAISELLNQEGKGQEIVAQIEARLGEVEAPEKKLKVLFIYARGAGSLNVSGTKTAADEMIQLAGAVNAVQEYEGYKPINSESIVAAAPDVILLTEKGLESMGGPEAVKGLPGVSLTPASENNRILGMDDLLLLGMGPRTGEAVVSLYEMLYRPELVSAGVE